MNKKLSNQVFKVAYCFPSSKYFYFLFFTDLSRSLSVFTIRISTFKTIFTVFVSEFTLYKPY